MADNLKNKYEWRTTPAEDNQEVPQEFKESFAPRSKPHNLFVKADGESHKIDETEYLVGYSNGLVAVGMIKHEKDFKDQPLTMQFGNWKHLHGKELYVGCSVMVRRYACFVFQLTKEPRPIVGKNATMRDFFYKGCFSANTLATEWAIVHKPKIECSLGRVLEFSTAEDERDRGRFKGKVYDQENQIARFVPDDNWPTYIKKPVEINRAVILNWVHITEPHIVFHSYNYLKVLLPEHASRYLSGTKMDSGYWLCWVDTCFNPDA